MQARTRAEACSKIAAEPPALMAFNDVDKAIEVCPDLERALKDDYVERTRGSYKVFLRIGPARR